MSTFAIVAGFALMLFLPCMLTVFNKRDQDDDVAVEYYDPEDLTGSITARSAVVSASEDIPDANPEKPHAPQQFEWDDPPARGRRPGMHSGRPELAELQGMRSHAITIRAHADALAAKAQVALDEAATAAQEAMDAELAAVEAILEFRRAA